MADLNPAVLIGSQYYVNTGDHPEQVRGGIRSMAQAGLKLVRIFLQWTHVEPRQGQWDWSQYDALFEAAAEGGLGVIITLTALHPPGWMRVSFGPQDLGPLDDPVYWERAKDYIRRACERYANHPAMHSWILSNEPQLILTQDEAVLKRFQQFVEQSYSGDIAALNRRSFQQYDSFDQVSFAGTEGGFSGYTGRLTWLNFMGYRLQEILAEIKAVIRASGDTHPVHVNPHGLVNDMVPRGQSIWAEGRLVDFMGCSAHPSWHSTRFLSDRVHQSVALFTDLMRGATRAAHRYFWVTELQGGTNIYSGSTYLGPSGEDLRSWVWESPGAYLCQDRPGPGHPAWDGFLPALLPPSGSSGIFQAAQPAAPAGRTAQAAQSQPLPSAAPPGHARGRAVDFDHRGRAGDCQAARCAGNPVEAPDAGRRRGARLGG